MKKIMFLFSILLHSYFLVAQEEKTTDSLVVLNQYVTFNYSNSGLMLRGGVIDMVSLGLILNKNAKHKCLYFKGKKINASFHPFNTINDSYWLVASFRMNNDTRLITQQKLIFEYIVKNKTYTMDIPLSSFKTKQPIKRQRMKIPQSQRPPAKK
jgi:hypothetical protein